MTYVTLSHLRSKGRASAYITYCTGSGNEIYAHLTVQYAVYCSVKCACYIIPKNPKNYQISLMHAYTACFFI